MEEIQEGRPMITDYMEVEKGAPTELTFTEAPQNVRDSIVNWRRQPLCVQFKITCFRREFNFSVVGERERKRIRGVSPEKEGSKGTTRANPTAGLGRCIQQENFI